MIVPRPCVMPITSLVLPLVPLAAGCSGSTTSHMNRTIHRAHLDDCYEIKLVHRSSKHREGWRPATCSEETIVLIEPRVIQSDEYSARRVDVPGWPSWSSFEFGDVEARCDAARERIWFLDRASGRVVASVDRCSRQTTGPGDPAPPWATADGGQRLD